MRTQSQKEGKEKQKTRREEEEHVNPCAGLRLQRISEKKDSRVAILWEETMFDLTRRWRREMQRFSITTDGHHSVIFTCFPCDRSSDKKAHVTC